MSGKTLMVAGLCRLFANRGLKVRPFKPQNMSNNAAVTPDGEEIARSIALQAQACGIAPSSDMNPVLLKPQAKGTSQVIVNGKVMHSAVSGREYLAIKAQLKPYVLSSFARVCTGCDLVIVEGAGSPAEVNLRDNDIANMGFACAAKVPVFLIGDIDRGGVIAALIGTWTLLTSQERAQIRGFWINRFRGDTTLFTPALATLKHFLEETPCLGVVPWWLPARYLPEEDSLIDPVHARALSGHRGALGSQSTSAKSAKIKVCALYLDYSSNLDDLDPWRHHPNVTYQVIKHGVPLPHDVDVIILPGSKSVIHDLTVLHAWRWHQQIHDLIRRGVYVIGLCGGYQMLGMNVTSIAPMEGQTSAAYHRGLGVLPIVTELTEQKITQETSGTDAVFHTPVRGYRIHTGHTKIVSNLSDVKHSLSQDITAISDGHIKALSSDVLPLFSLNDHKAPQKLGCGDWVTDGMYRDRIWGTYWHGLWQNPDFLHHTVNLVGRSRLGVAMNITHLNDTYDPRKTLDETLDGLATHLEQHLNINAIYHAALTRMT